MFEPVATEVLLLTQEFLKFILGVLALPLVHGFLNKFSHVVPLDVVEVAGVVERTPIEGVFQKGIEFLVQTQHHQLDVAAIHCAHQRRYPCVRYRVYFALLHPH
mmetsp:Transcript_11072/g.13989  ORF Transcript_11072/g.13989 Transcript_11072/m.13989 type:complete len:104 (-) Transcript_11072:302-613(-)